MASAHSAEIRALAETLSREELIQQLVTMEGHKTENKKISDQRDRVVRKMRRQAEEIKKLKADKKKFFDGVVEACQFDECSEDELITWVGEMADEHDPEMMRELKELMKDYESVIPDDYDTATPDDIKKVIETLNEEKEETWEKGWQTGKEDTFDEIDDATEPLNKEIEGLKKEIQDLKELMKD